MTSVRRHSTRRYHAPNKQQGFMKPNRPRSRNATRAKKGLRTIHCHQNVGMANLNWEKEVVLNKKQKREQKNIADKRTKEEKEKEAKLLLQKNARSIYGWISTIVANTTRRLAQIGAEASPELRKWQQAKSALGYILADMMEIDSALPMGERLKRVHKRVRPTFENVYLPSGEIVEGRTYVKDKMQGMSKQDNRFVAIMNLV